MVPIGALGLPLVNQYLQTLKLAHEELVLNINVLSAIKLLIIIEQNNMNLYYITNY